MAKREKQKKYTIALVGAGVVAARHRKAIDYLQKKKRASLLAVVDSNEAAAAAFLGSKTIPVYTSLEALLETTTPDLVAITTPSGSHFALGKMALEKGCHVLIEKPMTMAVSEANELLALAREKERIISVGHIYRYVPISDAIHEMATDGRLGRCLYGTVQVRWGHDQAYYDKAAWRGTYADDGGVLLNQAVHAIDLMQWLINREALEAQAIVATQHHEMEAEDLALGVVRFRDNVYLQVEATTNSDPAIPEAAFTLFFAKGEMRVVLYAGKLTVVARRYGEKVNTKILSQAVRSKIRKHGLGIIKHLGNPHTFLYLDTVRAMDTGTPAIADGQSGKAALATVLALYRSAKERQTVSIQSTLAFPLSDMVWVPTTNAENPAEPAVTATTTVAEQEADIADSEPSAPATESTSETDAAD